MYSLKKRTPLSYEELLQFYREEVIYMFYLGDNFCVNKFISSPFPDRSDSTPSFKLRYKNNTLIWHDFGDVKSTKYPKSVVGFVMRYFEIPSYIEALKRIMSDMADFEYNKNILKSLDDIRAKSNRVTSKGITVRKEFKDYEIEFWASLGVDLSLLQKYNVRAVVECYIDNKLWRKTSKYDPMFAYILNEDVEHYAFQVYRPLAEEKVNKFRDHNVEGHLFGLEQLPKNGDTLIITKSCKDVLVLASRGYNAICPFSEASYVHLLAILPKLFERFNHIYIMYDPDPAGIGYSQKVIEEYGGELKNILIPESLKKDPADNVVAGLEQEFFDFLKEEVAV